MNWTHEQLRQLGYTEKPDGSFARTESVAPGIPHPKPQPSPRQTLTTLSKEKQRTSQHLDSALLASPATHSMLITLLADANSSSTPSEDADSFLTTIRRQLKSHSVKLRPKQKPKKEPPSELPSDKQQQGDYKGEKP
jgi:hypothetical protein